MTMNQPQRQFAIFAILSLSGLLLVLGVLLTSLMACSADQPPPPSKDQPPPSATDQTPPPPATEGSTTPSTGSLWDNLKDKAGDGLTDANTLLGGLKDKAGSSLTDAKNGQVK